MSASGCAPVPRSALLLLLGAAACSAYEHRALDRPPDELAAPPPDAATICVYRPHRLAALVPAVVHDNGRLVGVTRGPSYFCYLAEPGRHTLVTRYGDDIDAEFGTDDIRAATVDVAAGERHYLHHDVTGILRIATVWQPDGARAERAITGCTYLALRGVPPGESPLSPGERAPAAPDVSDSTGAAAPPAAPGTAPSP